MVKLNTVVAYLNKELRVKTIKDPWSINGLQVPGSKEVDKIGVATDACMDTFSSAKKLGCDMLIVHHGLVHPKKRASITERKQIVFLKKNGISLYASHLPLDKHITHGNNANLLRLIGSRPGEIFDDVGYTGRLNSYRNIDSITKDLNTALHTKCKVWKFGKSKAKKVAVVSGHAGTEGVDLAVEKKADVLITGDGSHGMYLRAKDGKMNVILAGHYSSETIGVMALGFLLEKRFGVKAVFIDNPTGL
jgi:dinuclear metal center YbgI/SA1388 family protein